MKSFLTVISLALAFVSPAFAGIDWGFPNGTGSYTVPGGTATVNAGTYGSGWHDVSIPSSQWSAFGTSGPGASGLWDLGSTFGGGTPGSILLTIGSGSGLTTLNIFQWYDPTLYIGDLTVKLNGSVITSSGNSLIAGTGTLYGAGWYDYIYSMGPGLQSGDQVSITAGAGGAIIDQLTLVPEPATMIAGAILLIPFALSTWPILRRRKTS